MVYYTDLAKEILVSELVFFLHYNRDKSPNGILEMIYNKFLSNVEKELKDFYLSFTYETDCAAVVPWFFGASVPTHQISFSERRTGCKCHKLNTAMKHVIEQPCTRQ